MTHVAQVTNVRRVTSRHVTSRETTPDIQNHSMHVVHAACVIYATC